MLLYSTNNPQLQVSFREAVFTGMPADNGLFMPVTLPKLPAEFFTTLTQRTLSENASVVAQALIGPEIPASDLNDIISRAINFPSPLIPLAPHTHVLELFHGPSLAFKDFGARFMAQIMGYFLQSDTGTLTILVATSGDTGGAVAAGFHRVPGIKVVVLYPSGQVSPLQEKQFAALGDNVSALEVKGSFDDCQLLVKKAFLDKELRQRIPLSTANSINIARLIPQILYYLDAFRQLPPDTPPPVFSVPSGNFGNLTAGLFAKKMGLPVAKFIAATNINDVVPQYLHTGIFTPRPSHSTLSSAMDVGNPSNFTRILELYGSTWNIITRDVAGYKFSDEETASSIKALKAMYNYIIDPHGAVGYLALEKFKGEHPAFQHHPGIVLGTAHPAKFIENVTEILQEKIEIPERLSRLADLPKLSIPMSNDYNDFRNWLWGQ